ncbi:hypothetical protein F3157_11055 [Virgibacillus dakarensis]|uniref:Uncharacterized protein n=1 Tax=Lentibacillus populi TaxID=1827502 RepID=A0A9W5TWV6_9BACI|nr:MULTISPECIES: hypothetical protein [Bacillaceae]MTW86194.1 hypothetical protein [Virgibacillus dakarensis]GGB38528.1 hypothetical protein GCM10011409_15020 [Lentibacillus populi]
MAVKKKKSRKKKYFHLPVEDRREFELEVEEKEQKMIAAEKVFAKLDKKYPK